jgi:hypothetical protein
VISQTKLAILNEKISSSKESCYSMIQYKEANNDLCVNCSELKDSRANLDLIKHQIPEASIGGQERED